MRGMTKKDTANSRLFGINELATYLCVGTYSARKIGEAAGAKMHFGKRVLYDRAKIDEYITSTRDAQQ